MSLIKQLAKETAIYGLSSILVRLLPFAILTPYLTSVFSKQEYGVIIQVYTYIAFLVVLFSYRMETTFFRYGSKKGALENTFSTASLSLFFTTGFWLLFFGIFLSELTYLIHGDLEKQNLVFLMLCIVGTDALVAIPFARLRLEEKPFRFAVIKSINVLTNILVVFFLLEICPWLIEHDWEFLSCIYRPEWRISYVFIANLVASLITLIIFLPDYFKLRLRFDFSLWKKMMVYTGPLVVVHFASVINQMSGNDMLHKLVSSDNGLNLSCVGVYGAVAKIAVFMTLYTQAFNYAAEPFFFNNAERSDAKQEYADIARLFTLIGCIVLLGIWFYLDLIKYFIGGAFHEGLAAVPVLLLAYLFLGLYYNFSIWYKLTDQTKYGGYIAVIGSVITLSLNYILISKTSLPCYMGPAWAALGCYGFMAVAAYWLGQRKYPIPYNIRAILSYLGFTLVLFGISFTIKQNFYPPPFIFAIVNSAWFLVFLFIVYKYEKSFLIRIFKKS